MSSPGRFWDRIASRYAKQPVADDASYRKKLEVTRRYLRPDMEVLELGCGTGSTAILHAPHVRHIHAIDFSEKMIAIARTRAAEAGVGNVSFDHASIDELEVPDGSLDVVLALSILHLLEDRDAVIARVHRMLKPAGVFVSSTICMGDSMRWLRIIAPAARLLGLMPFVSFFTASELEAGLTSAGFAIDYRWQPSQGKAVFIVARKSG